jgi:alkylation response protein AidB-like acyl-CoA dehydrogenase
VNFELTQEQRLVLDMTRSFAEKEVKPVAGQMDHDSVFPIDLVTKLGELGLLGIFVPLEWGGSGMDFISYILALEEISKAWASLGVIMSLENSLICETLLKFGSDTQKRKYLPAVASGKLLGCYALTEPSAGSDAGSIQTQAKKQSDNYLINGSKIFITCGKHANFAIVYAVTDGARGKQGISAFIIEKNTPGFSVGKIEDKMGLRASDTVELPFQDCRVPVENLLGGENEGFKIALATLDVGRIGIAAQALGLAQGCLDQALAHAKQRQQFGQPIGNFQAIQWMLADMATEIEAARCLTYRAASLYQQGGKVTKEAAMAKLFSSEAANRAAYKAVQIFGGYGYMKNFDVERLFRDARITTIYEGTSEIQHRVIARQLLRAGGD